MESDAPMIAAMVALSMTLVELVKVLIVKFNRKNGNGGGCRTLTEDQHKALFRIKEQTAQLVAVHAPLDRDGIPLVQVPRGWARTQKEISQACAKISETQLKMLAVLEHWSRNKSIAPPPRGEKLF